MSTDLKGVDLVFKFYAGEDEQTASRFSHTYSAMLEDEDLDTIFTDDTKTKFVPNVNNHLRKLIIEKYIIPYARHTTAPDVVIPPLLNSCAIYCAHPESGQSSHPPRLSNKILEQFFEECQARKSSPKRLDVIFDITNLHFQTHAKQMTTDWSKISLVSPTTRHEPTTTTTAPTSSIMLTTSSTTATKPLTTAPAPTNTPTSTTGSSTNANNTPTTISPKCPLAQSAIMIPSTHSKIPTSIPHKFVTTLTDSFAIHPGTSFVKKKLDYTVAASPIRSHKAPHVDTPADDDPTTPRPAINLTTLPHDIPLSPVNTTSSFPSGFPTIIHPNNDPEFDTMASPYVCHHVPNIDTLADDDPYQGRVFSDDVGGLATDPYQRRVCSYADSFSNAPPIGVLADDNPHQPRICA